MKIRELLSSSERWAKKYYAFDEFRNSVYAQQPEAVCWCLAGAIQRCYPREDQVTAVKKLETSIKELFPDCHVNENDSLTVFFNDHYATFEQVRKVVEHADI